MKKANKEGSFMRRTLFSAILMAVIMLMGCGETPTEETAYENNILQTSVFSYNEDTKTPETKTPETKAPETKTPETKTPETKAPETEALETEAPKTEVPETEAPETEAPETNAPETEATGDGAEVLESSMTEERIGALVGKAYFWAPSGNKIHVKSDCRSFGKGVAYAGTFDQASAVRTGGFCGICSKGASADENPLATAEILAGCYTYEDFMNGVPAWAY